MKKSLYFLVFIMMSATIFGQDIIINFAGTGASANVETVEIVNLSNCTSIEVPDNSSLNLSDYVEVNELGNFESNSIQTYPNPFTGTTNIEFYVRENDNIKISVCNISGQIVAEYSSEMLSGVHSCKFIPNNSGMFFITVSGTNFLHTSKVMCISNISQKAQLIYQEQVSDEFFEKSDKNANSKDFSFTVGDRLKLKGISENYATIITDAPVSSKTYTFDFVECTDFDGNNYAVVKIGNQTWTAENLRTTHYSNGDEIPLIEDNTEWGELGDNDTDKAYCYYNNNANGEADIYGALYTWAAASNGENSETNPSGVQGACPVGWHLPSDAEWTELIDYLGGTIEAGGKLKETCTTYWNNPNTGATNLSGFSARPGGYRDFGDGTFADSNEYCHWWSTTKYSGFYVWRYYMSYDSAGIHSYCRSLSYGYSVRCIKD